MTVQITREHGVALVEMDRPDVLNTFSSEQMKRVRDVFLELDQDRSIRCIVLTGTGDRAFAAGADISEMVAMDRSAGMFYGRLGHEMTGAVARTHQPVVAAVNGYALGGGCEIAIAADIRIASENAVFAQPEVTLGIPPGWGGTQRLPRIVGTGLASDMILTGRRVKADEALRIGLVSEVVPLADLRPRAVEIAEVIASNGPFAVEQSKRLIGLTTQVAQQEGLAEEAEAFGEAFAGEEQAEGMKAFLEKRKPAYSQGDPEGQ